MKQLLNVAVVGLGTMGSMHTEAWSRISDVTLAGVSALDREKTEAVAAQYNTSPYTDSDELFQKEEIHVVDLCVPTYLHKEYVMKAARAGKHVICEKPLALNVHDAQEMIDSCKQHGVHLYVGQVVRFFPEYVQARDQVKSGAIGKPGVVRLTRGGPFPRAWDNWYAEDAKSGGLIFDLMIHDFDWLRWTFGEVERVMARRVSRPSGREQLEYVLVTLRMADGTIAHVEGTWAHTSFRTSFEIAGDQGMIVHDSRNSAPLEVNMRSSDVESNGNGGTGGVAVPESPLFKDPFQRELEHFADCIRTGAKPVVSAYDALKAVEIAQAVKQSAELGQPVTLSRKEDY